MHDIVTTPPEARPPAGIDTTRIRWIPGSSGGRA
ncbi:MAG: hypothetical protein AVDCRST_MAG52-2065 [uncultured Blastococcus sp.]|uniref:Uncharacterized protein n=1 Tax=uncultured Blastococcus sp. TaxID=217144 RepID=A0A6J4IHW1_9ACTN|nr:MAG: hypothetical protein AVDCRST_MAG52-2065 [uncultured Blastococcus sp.]